MPDTLRGVLCSAKRTVKRTVTCTVTRATLLRWLEWGGVMAACQLPPALLLWLAPGLLAQQPLTLILSLALYEALILALTLPAALRLSPQHMQLMLAWAVAALQALMPGMARRYRRHVMCQVMASQCVRRALNVYIEPLVTRAHAPLCDEAQDGIAIPTAQPLWPLLRSTLRTAQYSAQDKGLMLCISGPPGSGRTTLLQHIAFTCATNRQWRYGMRPGIPLMLHLPDHAATILQHHPSLAHLAHSHLAPSQVAPIGWFERHLQRGRCVVLLDGLDEIARREDRVQVADWVNEQARCYPACLFIITVAPEYLSGLLPSNALVLQLQPFTPAQVSVFVRRWFALNDGAAARQHTGELMQRLYQSPRLGELSTRPLYLNMIVRLLRDCGQVPPQRAALIEGYADLLLQPPQSSDTQAYEMAARQRALLQTLASYMMDGQQRVIEADEATRVTGATRADLQHIASESGLLHDANGVWRFAHEVFQSYFVAASGTFPNLAKVESLFMVDDPWWHEAARLYADLNDATPVLQACLSSKTTAALALAVDVLDEASYVNPRVRGQVEDWLCAEVESPQPERRALAARAQLAARLRGLWQLPGQSSHQSPYQSPHTAQVTCAEYQLFINAMQANGVHVQPDHWLEDCHAPGDALQPVLGIRAEDAEAFCRWLSQWRPGLVTYRAANAANLAKVDAKHLRKVRYVDEALDRALGLLSERTRALIDRETRPPGSVDTSAYLSGAAILTRQRLIHSLSHYPFSPDQLGALDRPVAHELGSATAAAREQVRERAHAEAQARAHARRTVRVRACTRRLPQGLAADLCLVASRDLHPDPARDVTHAYQRALALAILLDYKLNGEYGEQPCSDSLVARDFRSARQIVREILDAAGTPEVRRTAVLLQRALDWLSAATSAQARMARQRYLAQLLEDACIGMEMVSDRRSQTADERRKCAAPAGCVTRQPGAVDALAHARDWLNTVLAREEGRMLPGEGEGLIIMCEYPDALLKGVTLIHL